MKIPEIKAHDLGVLAGLAEDWRTCPYDDYLESNHYKQWYKGRELGERLKSLTAAESPSLTNDPS